MDQSLIRVSVFYVNNFAAFKELDNHDDRIRNLEKKISLLSLSGGGAGMDDAKADEVI